MILAKNLRIFQKFFSRPVLKKKRVGFQTETKIIFQEPESTLSPDILSITDINVLKKGKRPYSEIKSRIQKNHR